MLGTGAASCCTIIAHHYRYSTAAFSSLCYCFGFHCPLLFSLLLVLILCVRIISVVFNYSSFSLRLLRVLLLLLQWWWLWWWYSHLRGANGIGWTTEDEGRWRVPGYAHFPQFDLKLPLGHCNRDVVSDGCCCITAPRHTFPGGCWQIDRWWPVDIWKTKWNQYKPTIRLRLVNTPLRESIWEPIPFKRCKFPRNFTDQGGGEKGRGTAEL